MYYRCEFINKFKNKDYLPNFEKPNFLLELEKKAIDAVQQKNLYGYLSAVLIYHQMKEEILKALFKKAQFFTQLNCFPKEIKFSQENYSMLYYVVNDNEEPSDFKNRKKILELSKELELIKFRIINGIAGIYDACEVENLTKEAKEIFEGILNAFKDSNLWFYRNFREFEQSELRSS